MAWQIKLSFSNLVDHEMAGSLIAKMITGNSNAISFEISDPLKEYAQIQIKGKGDLEEYLDFLKSVFEPIKNQQNTKITVDAQKITVVYTSSEITDL